MGAPGNNQHLFDPSSLPDASKFRFGIVVAEWNAEITEALYKGAIQTLKQCGVPDEHVQTLRVPGSFELVSGARRMATKQEFDAVICLGCVIQGETRHFEFICQAVAQGLTQLNILYPIPFIFGVLTTDTLEQARERCGGKHGHKGVEAAISAIKMVE